MSRNQTIATVLALGVAASACAPATHGLTAASNPSIYSVHQPVVQRTDYVFDVVTDGRGRVPAGELGRLNAWFASIELGYGDAVSVDSGSSYDEQDARDAVARVAADYGILLSDEAAPVTAGEVAPGTVRVIASRATASVPNCPDWDGNNTAPVNNTSTNYGCATNSNLSAMVANPNNLVLGQPGSVRPSGATATRAIRVYRQTQPTGSAPVAAPSTQGN